jgi:hypothetical protein
MKGVGQMAKYILNQDRDVMVEYVPGCIISLVNVYNDGVMMGVNINFDNEGNHVRLGTFDTAAEAEGEAMALLRSDATVWQVSGYSDYDGTLKFAWRD